MAFPGNEHLDDPEVAQECVAKAIEEDVVGLDVPVEVILRVDEVERLGHVHQPVPERRERHRPAFPLGARLHPVLEAPPGEILHHHVGMTVVGPDVDDPDNVRVAQVDQRADLQIKSLQEHQPGLLRVGWQRTLDHDLGFQVAVIGQVDLPHAASPDPIEDLVPAVGHLQPDPVEDFTHLINHPF